MNDVDFFHAEDENQRRIRHVVLVLVDVREKLVAHLVFEAFERMRELKKLVTTRFRRREFRIVKDDDQTDDAKNGEKSDQNETQLDDDARQIVRDEGVIQTGQLDHRLVDQRRKVVE